VLGVSWKNASQGMVMTKGIVGNYLDVFGVSLSIREKSPGKVYDIYTTIIPILLLGNLEMVDVGKTGGGRMRSYLWCQDVNSECTLSRILGLIMKPDT
jgi:hypothetical protein